MTFFCVHRSSFILKIQALEALNWSRRFDSLGIEAVAACRGPLDFRMVRKRATRVEQSEGVEHNWCSLIGGVSAGMVQLLMDRRRAPVDSTSLFLSCMCVWCESWNAYVCVIVRVYVRGGRRVVKQVAPKPRLWTVAVKYCGYFKNRSNPSCAFSSLLLNEQGALPILPLRRIQNTISYRKDLLLQKNEIQVQWFYF